MYLDGAIREVNFHLVNHNTFTNEINQSELVTKPCRTRVRRGKSRVTLALPTYALIGGILFGSFFLTNYKAFSACDGHENTTLTLILLCLQAFYELDEFNSKRMTPYVMIKLLKK